MEPSNKNVRLLISFDGGGLRGLITLYVMRHLESIFKCDITQKSTMICGTSTGGIIAFGKVRAISTDTLELIYLGVGKEIMKFSCNNLIKDQSACNTTEYTKQLSQYFQGNLSGYHIERPAFLTTSIKEDESSSTYEPFILSNYTNDKRKIAPKGVFDMPVVDALRATSAIPLLFTLPTANGYEFFDGGLSYNNGTELLVKEANQMFGQADADTVTIIISFGTGHTKKKKNISNVKPGSGNGADVVASSDTQQKELENLENQVNENDKKKKFITFIKNGIEKTTDILEATSRHVRSFVSVMKTLNRVSDSHKAHKKNKEVHEGRPNVHYFRFDPLLSKAILLNDCSPVALEQMRTDVKTYVESEKVKANIQQLATILKKYSFIK